MEKKIAYTWILLLCICLAPFVYFFFFSFPTADDYCASNYIHHFKDSISAWKNLYYDYNGRFTANLILSFSPMKYEYGTNYQWFLLIQFFILGLSIYYFYSSLSSFVNFSTQLKILFSLFSLVLIVHNTQDLAEGFYWLTGSVAYLAGNIFLLLHVSFLIRWFNSKNNLLFILCFFSLILSMGFNEIQSFVIPICYTFGIFIFIRKKIKMNLYFVGLLVIAWFCLILVLAAPGNFVRIEQYETNFDWFSSFGMSFIQTGRFLFIWIFNPIYVLFLLMLIHYFTFHKKINKIELPNYFWLLVIAILPLFLASLLPYLGTGILGQHRTINWAWIHFISCTIILALKISQTFSIKKTSTTQNYLLPILVVGVFFLFSNGKKAVVDLNAGNAAASYSQFKKRQELLLQEPNEEIYTLKNNKSMLFTFDVDKSGDGWIENCMRDYYIRANKSGK